LFSGGIRVPTLVIHGNADEIVPYCMGARVAQALPDAELIRVAGARHGDIFLRDGERLLSVIADFAG
jgi:pimeloyl-ACP methyl ester carboxylesterase